MFLPEVMRDGPMGEWQNPWDVVDGFKGPNLSQAHYPHLKTLMLEHHWNQYAPADPCNPLWAGGTYEGCEPYYFNAAFVSKPATLFYDGSTRLLPNYEAFQADETVRQQTGYGLWNRTTYFGENGYFSDMAFENIQLSHHVLTTDGILGRDTIELNTHAQPPPAVQPQINFTFEYSPRLLDRSPMKMEAHR